MRIHFTLLFFWLLLPGLATAEYRVFDLRIVHVDTGAERRVISTLDQYQYPDYYPVSLRERIDLIDHWMCWGDTHDFQRPCPNPKTNSAPTPP